MLSKNDHIYIPNEILLHICSYLPPEEIVKVSTLSKLSNLIFKNQIFWAKKFTQHFPHIYHKLRHEKNTIWYKEFIKSYLAEYEDLQPRLKKQFSLIKEADTDELIKDLQLDDFNKHDGNDKRLVDWAKEKNCQRPIYNHFYKMAIKKFLDNYTNVIDTKKTDLSERTILNWAILCGQPVSIINDLLILGADIHASNALHLAAQEGQDEIAEFLLQKRALINARSQMGATALLFAIENGHEKVVDVLLKNQADVTIPLAADSDYHKEFKVFAGDTPLHVTSRLNKTTIFDKLINAHANPEVVNRQHKKPFDLAVKGSNIFHKLALFDYSKKVDLRQNDHHKKSLTLFGHKFNFGYSAEQKKKAANALKSVVFQGADKSALNEHKKALENGDLKLIYRSFNIR